MKSVDRALIQELVRLIYAPETSEEAASVMGQAVAAITDLSDEIEDLEMTTMTRSQKLIDALQEQSASDSAEIVQLEKQLGLTLAAIETFLWDLDGGFTFGPGQARTMLEDRIAAAKAHLWTT